MTDWLNEWRVDNRANTDVFCTKKIYKIWAHHKEINSRFMNLPVPLYVAQYSNDDKLQNQQYNNSKNFNNYKENRYSLATLKTIIIKTLKRITIYVCVREGVRVRLHIQERRGARRVEWGGGHLCVSPVWQRSSAGKHKGHKEGRGLAGCLAGGGGGGCLWCVCVCVFVTGDTKLTRHLNVVC